MALSTMAVFGSAFFTPVIVGVMANTIGWPWSFYLVAILSGALLPVCFFFCPETAFVRSEELNNDMETDEKNATTIQAGHEMQNYHNSGINEVYQPKAGPSPSPDASPASSHTAQQSHQIQSQVIPTRPYSYWRSLLPFNGRKSNESFIKLFFRPFPLFFQPGILWATLTQGTLIGWTVFIGIVLAAILLGPPLFFSSPQVGYMYTSAFIGALLGFILCGVLSDSSAKWMTKLNKGVYEPEFRIVLVIGQFVFGAVGLYGFGWTAGNTYK